MIATSDNPRTESPERILDDMAAGFRAPRQVVRIVDRAEAIAAALGRADGDDVVLIAGKGHERYQDTADVRTPFDDADIVRELVEG